MTSLLGIGVQRRRDDIVVRRRGFNVGAMHICQNENDRRRLNSLANHLLISAVLKRCE